MPKNNLNSIDYITLMNSNRILESLKSKKCYRLRGFKRLNSKELASTLRKKLKENKVIMKYSKA